VRRRRAAAVYEYCDARGLPYERCGKVIVARSAAELPGLDALEKRRSGERRDGACVRVDSDGLAR